MKINNQLLKGLAIGLGIVGMFVLASFLYKKKNVKSSGGNSNNSNESEGKSIIIGSVKDPHSNLPIYKEIGKEIDEKL